jgi:transcriptional regulator with XRE-family HTH domain
MVVITRRHKTVNGSTLISVKNKVDPKLAFGERLRQLRKKVDLSQEGLSHRANLDRSYVGAVERGEVNISLINICILAEAIGVAPHELLLTCNPQKDKKVRTRKT